MKNVFSAIFLMSLFLLNISHSLQWISGELLQWCALTVSVGAAGALALKRWKWCYGLLVISFALLITGQFLKEKSGFIAARGPGSTLHSFVKESKGEHVYIVGRLTDFPEIAKNQTILWIETQRMEFLQTRIEEPYRVRIKVNGHLHEPDRGDIVGIDAVLQESGSISNFSRNPSEDYYLLRKIHMKGYCKSGRMVTVIRKGPAIWQWVGAWRNKIRERIEEKYERGDPPPGINGEAEEISMNPKGVFLKAIIIGDRGELTDEREDRFLRAGIYHILSISGSHIGIIALFFLGVLKWVNVSYKKRYVITGLILVLYLLLSGLKVPAERAVWMALFIFAARVYFLDLHIFNIISLCGLWMLVRNPAEFLDAGFILTYSLTAVIVSGRSILVPKLKKMGGFAAELISANISASLISLPLTLYYFQQYSFAGFFSGLVSVPLAGVITALGFLLIPMALLSHFLCRVILFVLDGVVGIFFKGVDLFSIGIDLQIFRASPPLIWVAFVLAVFLFLPQFRSAWTRAAAYILILGSIAAMALDLSPRYRPARLEVFYLDVGQGDSQVVVFPGGDGLLIDGGGSSYSDFDVGERIVLPFILRQRIQIKYVAISHFHADHAVGVGEIIPIIKPRETWISSEASEDPSYRDVMRSISSSSRTRIIKRSAPYRGKIGGCTVEFLYPDRFIPSLRAENNHSQVIRVSDGSNSFLFTGDIEKDVEEILIGHKNKKIPLRSTVLKVPHHGSSSSSTLNFLKRISPQLAVFSYAPNNRFHFPHRGTLENYKRLKIPYLATARSGGIRVVSLPGGIRIETTK